MHYLKKVVRDPKQDWTVAKRVLDQLVLEELEQQARLSLAPSFHLLVLQVMDLQLQAK